MNPVNLLRIEQDYEQAEERVSEQADERVNEQADERTTSRPTSGQ